jgi:hypothetical protein
MSYNELYQFYTTEDGNIVYENPIYYLLNYQNMLTSAKAVQPTYKAVNDNEKMLNIAIKEKYTKIKDATPQGGLKNAIDRRRYPMGITGMPDPMYGQRMPTVMPKSLHTFKF